MKTMCPQARELENLQASEYVKFNNCLLAYTGTSAYILTYSECRPIADLLE
jgi:hypothetical protein